MLIYISGLLLFIIGSLLVDLSTASLYLFYFVIGTLTTKYLNKNNTQLGAVKIYQIAFLLGFAYILMCYTYMVYHNYDYLLIFDTKVAYLPKIKEYLEFGKRGGYLSTFSHIWETYELYDKFSVGFYSLTTLFAYISLFINSNLYISIQLGILLLTSFTGVIIYRTLLINEISENKSYKYALLITLCTILFFYSTLIIRDGLIALFFAVLIYISFLPLTYTNLFHMTLLVFVIMLFRIESGIFAVLFLPLYILIINFKSIYKRSNFIFLSIVFFILFTGLVYLGLTNFTKIYAINYTYYIANVSYGDGIIGMLQRLPIGLRELTSIIYTALQPIPCYAKMLTQYYGDSNPESYNIIAFPTLIAAFFNFYAISFMVVILVSKNKVTLNRAIKSLIYLAILFLGIQSAVVEQRRVMGFYIVFFIIFAKYHSNTNLRDRNIISSIIVVMFVVIQIVLLGFQY